MFPFSYYEIRVQNSLGVFQAKHGLTKPFWYRNVSNFTPPVCRFRKVFTTSSLGFWLQGRG